jgi:DegV family protein with EDD domain
MKQKIAIVTDSSSSLDHIPHRYDHVFMVRMPIHFGDEELIDGLTISVNDFYDRLKNEETIPSTSQPPLGESLELYERLKEEGYTDIIHYPISKGLSGTYQSLFSIKDMVEGINIHIIDTKSTALILGYIVLEAAKLLSEDKTVEEIINYSNYLADSYRAYFMVDDLKYLIKNGRLSNAAGFIGSVLKIKPILTFNDQGEIVGTEKIRTTKKAMNHIIESALNETKEFKSVQFFIAYGADQELTEQFKEQVSQHIDLNTVFESILPSVIGAHVGSGIVALGYFILEK